MMRVNIVHDGAKFLEYEIRKIVEQARHLQDLGLKITWENIGDPVAMREEVTPWIKEIVQNLVAENASWAYCPSRGVLKTREFLADQVNARNGVQITPDDLIFFNGVADAIDKVYDLIHPAARVLLPSPVYSTHSSNESKRGGYKPLHFRLDPKNNWMPDLDEIRNHVKYNPQVAGIGLVNPDNPTGIVYPEHIMREIVEIARQNKLFLVVDEIYTHICYNGAKTLHLSQVVEDVPAIAMRGISKEYPWPGARCAWMEILNKTSNPAFKTFTDSILSAKMLEVCATTLPQLSIPRVFGDVRYPEHLKKRASLFEARANEACDIFSIPGLICNKPHGAFYLSLVFEEGVLNQHQSLPIKDESIRKCVEQLCHGASEDKRFVYYLLGSEGICVTPLSGFSTDLKGFRVTFLNPDDIKRRDIFTRIANAVRAYLNS